MAGVDVESGGRSRSINRDINMIPFIDLLLVTIAFLLITAVWVTHSRIAADTQVPSDAPRPPDTLERVLHVHAEDGHFVLRWKNDGTTTSETRVPRGAPTSGGYPQLAEAVAAQWEEHGLHRVPSDMAVDRAVLHTPDGLSFKEMVAMMDAVHGTRRPMRLQLGRAPSQVAAFHLSLAVR